MNNKLMLMIAGIMISLSGFARDLERGYRGFIDWDNAIGKSDYLKKDLGHYGYGTLWFIGISTSHGYQFNEHWFLGGGAMISCAFPSCDKFLPAFVEARYDAKFGKITPYIDFRGGYYYDCEKSGGLYLSPTIGYSFRTSNNLNFNLGIGMTVRGFTKDFYRFQGHFITHLRSETTNYTFFAARLGIDFK